jgi:uncharacterized membrane protein
MYNIHPLLVHFPIAFFLLYSLLRILPFEKWLPKISWRQIRQVVLLAGFLGGLAANATGEIAEHMISEDNNIVGMHSFFAAASLWIYGLILAGEILYILNPYIARKFPALKLSVYLKKIELLLTNPKVGWILALVGVITISITGLLGGVMVYGSSADPLAPFVLKVLGLY